MSLKNCKLAKRINHYSLINFQFSSAPFDFFHSFPVCAQLRWLRDISLMGAATPPSPERGIPAHSVFLVCCKLSGKIRMSEPALYAHEDAMQDRFSSQQPKSSFGRGIHD